MSKSHVDVAFEQFKREIRPAVVEESTENANKLGAWLVAHGYDVRMMDSAAIAEALYKAASTDLLRGLAWKVAPAKLKKYLDAERPASTPSAIELENQRQAQKKKDDELKAYNEAQLDAKRKIDAAINSFRLPLLSRTQDVKDEATAILHKAIKNKTDLRETLKTIRTLLDAAYTADEKRTQDSFFNSGRGR